MKLLAVFSCRPHRAALAALVAAALSAPTHAQERFLRGDTGGDGELEIADAIQSLQVLFVGEPLPGCVDAMDVNDDGRLNIVDPIFSLRFLFLGGEAPPAPFGACGLDSTEDSLGCREYPPCAVSCLDQEAVNAILGGATTTSLSLCIPAGVINLPSGQLSISVCPSEGAAPCGDLQAPGCPIEITSVSASLHVEEARVVIHIEGKMYDLPVLVAESVFGTSTTCQVDFHGAEEGTPFSLDVVLPLVLEERQPGALTITGVGETAIENVVMQLTAGGGLLCRLLQAGQAVLVEGLVGFLDQAAAGLTAGLEGQLVGLNVCAPPPR